MVGFSRNGVTWEDSNATGSVIDVDVGANSPGGIYQQWRYGTQRRPSDVVIFDIHICKGVFISSMFGLAYLVIYAITYFRFDILHSIIDFTKQLPRRSCLESAETRLVATPLPVSYYLQSLLFSLITRFRPYCDTHLQSFSLWSITSTILQRRTVTNKCFWSGNGIFLAIHYIYQLWEINHSFRQQIPPAETLQWNSETETLVGDERHQQKKDVNVHWRYYCEKGTDLSK